MIGMARLYESSRQSSRMERGSIPFWNLRVRIMWQVKSMLEGRGTDQSGEWMNNLHDKRRNFRCNHCSYRLAGAADDFTDGGRPYLVWRQRVAMMMPGE